MKKMYLILVVLLAISITSHKAESNNCWLIEDGVLLASTGELLELGYDQYGYNYQAHIFNGRYCDYDRMEGGDYCDVDLIMKWNNAWMSNKSCDGDLYLDRHYPLDSYIDSGAWLTNHQSGKVEVKGKMRKWTYFVKIVAVSSTDVQIADKWFTADGIEIGIEIWGAFAIIQRVSNDPSLGEHGIQYKSAVAPGFGKY